MCALLLGWAGLACRLGTNVKVINSVLMDGVIVGDAAHIQNSVVCPGANVQAGGTLKDCQVGSAHAWHAMPCHDAGPWNPC